MITKPIHKETHPFNIADTDSVCRKSPPKSYSFLQKSMLGNNQLQQPIFILKGALMAKYKRYDYKQSVMIPVSLEDQLMPGTLEFAIHRLVEEYMRTIGVAS